MKIGFYSESPADQAALAVFTGGILGEPPEPINMDLEAHGVGGVFNGLDGVVRGLHYNSDAEGLVVVIDSDDSEMHEEMHDTMAGGSQECRLCRARKIVAQTRKHLRPRIGRSALKVAIGLTVPAIEAWHLVGKNPYVGEAQWKVAIAEKKYPFTRPVLKKLVYGTERPSIELETRRAVEEARRIVDEKKDIETSFPVGYGLMAQEIRSWKR